MATCDSCGTFILFGGVREGGRRYCGAECAAGDLWAALIDALPAVEVDERARRTHQGQCPKCLGAGPVDVRSSHWIYSALAFSRYGSRFDLCCRRCGRKTQLKDGLFSLALGWWGFPHGIILTPVQVVRDLGAFVGLMGPRDAEPSPQLRNRIARSMAVERAGGELPGRFGQARSQIPGQLG